MGEVETQPDWVIVMCRPSSEEVAERGLRSEGYRVYLPRFRKMLRPHGSERSGQPSMRPAFTGYLFCQDWLGWPVRPIPGVVGMMRKTGGRPELISAADVDIIRAREWAGAFDDARAPIYGKQRRSDLEEGDRVEYMLYGERILAVLHDLSENGKAIIFNIVGANGKASIISQMTVNAEELEKVVA